MTPLDEELKTEEIKKGRLFFKILVASLFLIILGGFFFVILGRISTATMKIVLHRESIDIDSRLRAFVTPSVTGLSFGVTQTDSEESQAVVPTGSASGGQKSSGRIIIYNNYSSAPQKLIANTRFETSDGKIYRIRNSVLIPGNGSLETTVFADKAGEEFNIGLVDFTIPGLKGGPKFEKIFAKSKTTISGGAGGNVRIVRKDDIETARTAVRDRLKGKLVQLMKKQTLADTHLVYQTDMKMEYIESADNPQVGDSSGKSMIFKVKGIATGYLIKNDALNKALVDNNAGNFERKPNNDLVSIKNIESLDFDLISADAQNKEITINVKGKAEFVWSVDGEKLKDEILAYNGKDYKTVFLNYPAIEKTDIYSKPSFWKKIPKNRNKIKIEYD